MYYYSSVLFCINTMNYFVLTHQTGILVSNNIINFSFFINPSLMWGWKKILKWKKIRNVYIYIIITRIGQWN